MWTARDEPLANGRMRRTVILLDGTPVSYFHVLDCWKNDGVFRSFFLDILTNSPYSAFRWETPPITRKNAIRAFEFVLLDSPELVSTADSASFAEHFRGSEKEDIAEFPNLGRDAILVAPCPKGPLESYAHLAAFVRLAAESQKHALWERVGDAMLRRLGTTPVWLSTAGAGVPWLHVRLDDRPKYYGYQPYR